MNLSMLKSSVPAVLAALALAGCSKQKELHVYTWCDYIAPEVLAKFEQAND